MKKSLSLLVAIAMVFSMFATVVSAAEETINAGKYLQELGVIKGNAEGDLKEDQTWKRQDIIVLLSRLMGEEAEAKATKKSHKFTDVTDKNYDGYISWAVEKGLAEGKGNNKFGFGNELKNQELYAFIIRVFADDVAYADVPAKAIELKFATAETNMAAIPLRGATYDVIVTALNTEVPGTGKSLGEVLGLIVVTEVKATASAVGVKKLEVKFNQAVDTAKAKFSVKKGSATVNIADEGVKFSDDKKTATLSLVNKLTNGEYTVTTTGLTEEALTSVVTAKDETVTEIKFLSDKAPVGTIAYGTNAGGADFTTISTSFKITNQYGEDVTKAYEGSLNINASKGSKTVNNGKLTLTVPNGTFITGELVVVTAVYSDNHGATSATATLTVSAQARVDKVEVIEVYNADKKSLTTSSTWSDFYLLVNAFDQYGNKSTLNEINAQVSVYVSNPTIFNVANNTFVGGLGANSDQIGLPLAGPTTNISNDGKNTVRFVSNFTGKQVNYDVDVAKGSRLYDIKLEKPAQTVAANDGTVKIPFTATDANGAVLTTLEASQLTLSATGSFTVKHDHVKKESYLEWAVPTTQGTYSLTAFVVGGTKVSQILVDVKENAVPTTVGAVQKVAKNLMVGASVSINEDNIVIYDQFGRVFDHTDTASFYAAYDILVTAGGTGKATVTGVVYNNTDSVSLNAIAKGNEVITIALANNGSTTPIGSTAFTYNVSVLNLADIAKFEVKDLPSIYYKSDSNTTVAGLEHAVALEVIGKKSDGSDVVVPSSIYYVTTNKAGLTYNQATGKLEANGVVADLGLDGDATSADVKVSVIVETANGAEAIQKDAKVLEGAPAITTVTLDEAVKTIASGTTNINTLFGEVVVKDQYGVAYTANANEFTANATNFTNFNNNPTVPTATVNKTSADQIVFAGLEVGDTFQVTFTSKKGGHIVTIKAVVQN